MVNHETLSSQLNDEGDGRERELPDTNPRKGDDVLAAKQAADKIQKILQRLPESQRSAVLLSRFEGLSYQEVAEVLGTTEKAVKSLVFRATQSLREGLREYLENHDDL